MNEHIEARTAAVLNGFFQTAADVARAEHWAAIQQAEACDPNVLRALREQQQGEQARGMLS